MTVPVSSTAGHGATTAAALRRKARTCRRAADALDPWKPILANEYLADAAALDRLADEHERLNGTAHRVPNRTCR